MYSQIYTPIYKIVYLLSEFYLLENKTLYFIISLKP